MVKESVSVEARPAHGPLLKYVCWLNSLEDHVDTLDHGAKMILAG